MFMFRDCCLPPRNRWYPTGCPETSVRNYHYVVCNNPEECRSQCSCLFMWLLIPTLKSRTTNFSVDFQYYPLIRNLSTESGMEHKNTQVKEKNVECAVCVHLMHLVFGMILSDNFRYSWLGLFCVTAGSVCCHSVCRESGSTCFNLNALQLFLVFTDLQLGNVFPSTHKNASFLTKLFFVRHGFVTLGQPEVTSCCCEIKWCPCTENP